MIKATPSKKPLLNAEIEDSNAASSEDKITTSAITMGNDEEGVRETKKGHKLFFICCDTKRAVLWLNTIVLLLNIFIITAAIVQSDRAKAEGYTQAMIVRGCGLFVTFTTILGAYWYSKSIVLVGLVFTCYHFTVSIFKISRYNWDGGYNEEGKLAVILPVIWNSLLFYAEGMFISEINDDTMSAETYKRREKYSCCCNF